jgi:hypothetical protein
VAVVIDQLWGPVVNLVGDGGYSAWTVGTWLVVKGANLIMYAVIAVVFLLGAFINIPEHHQDTGEDRS